MLDNDDTTTPDTPDTPDTSQEPTEAPAPAKKAAAKRTTAKKAAAPRKTAAARKAAAVPDPEAPAQEAAQAIQGEDAPPAKKAPARKRATKKTAAAVPDPEAPAAGDEAPTGPAAPAVLFQAPETTTAPARKRTPAKKAAAAPAEDAAEEPAGEETPKKKGEKKSGAKKKSGGGKKKAKDADKTTDGPTKAAEKAEEKVEAPAEEPGDADGDSETEGDGDAGPRRRRRRGGRRRRKPGGADSSGDEGSDEDDSADDVEDTSDHTGDNTGDNTGDDTGDGESTGTGSRRRRRRRRAGDDGGSASDDPEKTVTRARKQRNPEDEITGISGSTRLEAKKQRRREGREAGRRRAPIVSEAEFLARRESVDRVMVIRQRDDLTQIGVLEDKVLVEHYVARESQTSLIGNVYLGRVQNVLPSMEAAFIDIGRGRNAVLYAGEVNWDALGAKDGGQRKIEQVLKPGQPVLVQVTKDPIGHKGARLTSQVSLPGRFLVYVPDGTTSGISRKLPENERNRLKTLLKEIVPDTAGVIVRTAAEGASEDELTRDVERLKARWEDIEKKVEAGNAPQLLYGEPDLTVKVVRDLFTEDFRKLVISGADAWETVEGYVTHVAPDLSDRLERHDDSGADAFADYRIDEQIAKGLDRKVWLPSGGSLVIDRTEAMTVIDVNTGKFTGSGGNLEETVTKNNLEAAEEIVRQLRLRDIGGIIVVDFIDMVLESNRDLVLRRLVECLGRDRTRHQVAEVTSLGLVQMTRKRIGTGLLEAFSETCDHCNGRGLLLHDMPVEPKRGGGGGDEPKRGSGRRRGGRGKGDGDNGSGGSNGNGDSAGNGNGSGVKPSPAEFAAMAKHVDTDDSAAEKRDEAPEETPEETPAADPVAEIVEEPTAEEPADREPAVEEPAAEIPVAREPETEPEPEQPVAPPAPPVGPQIVTRARRGVSRTVTPTAAAPVEVAPAPTADAAAAPVAPPVPPAPPAPPKVTTRSRGRSRAAAPADDAPAAEPAPVEHVPVKKKGARKR